MMIIPIGDSHFFRLYANWGQPHFRFKKTLYSIVPAYALPEKFTLPELQELHEIIIGKPLQKKSFRRRLEQSNLLIDTGETRKTGSRPAKLYLMKKEAKEFYFIRNLEL